MTATPDDLAPPGALKTPLQSRGGGRRIVRRRLALLAVMALLPLAVMATLWLLDAVQRERARLQEVASALARDIVMRLDAELAGHVRALDMLAALPALDEDELSDAQEALGRALGAEPLWENLFLLAPDGRQVVNARVPGALKRTPVPQTVASVFQTGRVAVTDVAVGPGVRPAVALQVPVRRGDGVRYVLSGVLEPAPLAEVFRQILAPGWKAVVLDRQGRIVVRTSDGAARTGQLASEAARAALERGEEGMLRESASVDGMEHLAFFLRSPLTGWSVHAVIPRQELSPLQTNGVSFIVVGGATSALLAGLLGFLLVKDLQSEHRRQAALQEAQDRARNALTEANAALEARVEERTAELQAIIRQMPAGVIIAEAPSGRILVSNDLANRMLGFEAPHSTFAEGRHPHDRPHRPDKTPVALDDLPVIRAIRGGEEVIDEEMRFPQVDGTWMTMSVNAAPIRDSDGTVRAGIVTFTDISRHKQLEEQQAFLLAELQHRVKNMLAVVAALAQQTSRATGGSSAFVEALSNRIQALARVQDFMLADPEGKVNLHALLAAELSARGADPGERLQLSGPDVSLPGNIAQSLELVVHELATNAMKHGALKQAGGRVQITWLLEGGELRLDWRESGVSIAAPPARRGFGSKIIERTLATGGESSLEFAPDGVRCKIRIPLA